MGYEPPVLPPFAAKKEKILGRNLAAVREKYGLKDKPIVKLGSNENPLGISSAAKAAIFDVAAGASRYPDPDGDALRRVLAEGFGVPFEWVVLSAGSAEFVDWSARAFVGPGRAAVMSDYSFSAYKSSVKASGGRPISVPALEYGHDLPRMAAAIGDDVSVVFVTNPNNPTGTLLDGGALERFLEIVPQRVIVVLDEAYIQFVPQERQYDSMALVRRFPNLVVLRTFSKAYGLAGLRVGFGICQESVADVFARIRSIYSVNAVAIAAAAAAFRDTEHLAATIENNRLGMLQLTAGLNKLGYRYLPSYGNFIMVDVANGQTANERLLKEGVIVRTLDNYGLKEWVRISVGTPSENARLLEAIGPRV